MRSALLGMRDHHARGSRAHPAAARHLSCCSRAVRKRRGKTTTGKELGWEYLVGEAPNSFNPAHGLIAESSQNVRPGAAATAATGGHHATPSAHRSLAGRLATAPACRAHVLMQARALNMCCAAWPQPVFVRQDTRDAFQWRVRNVPYPPDVFSVGIDHTERKLVIRTSNKK